MGDAVDHVRDLVFQKSGVVDLEDPLEEVAGAAESIGLDFLCLSNWQGFGKWHEHFHDSVGELAVALDFDLRLAFAVLC